MKDNRQDPPSSSDIQSSCLIMTELVFRNNVLSFMFNERLSPLVNLTFLGDLILVQDYDPFIWPKSLCTGEGYRVGKDKILCWNLMYVNKELFEKV